MRDFSFTFKFRLHEADNKNLLLSLNFFANTAHSDNLFINDHIKSTLNIVGYFNKIQGITLSYRYIVKFTKIYSTAALLG